MQSGSAKIDLDKDPPQAHLFSPDICQDYARLGLIPHSADVNSSGTFERVFVSADPTAEQIDFIKNKFSKDLCTIKLASFSQVNRWLNELGREIFNDKAVYALYRERPGLSARTVFTKPQEYTMFGIAGILLLGLLYDFTSTLIFLNILLTAFLVVNFIFKFVLGWIGSIHFKLHRKDAPEDIDEEQVLEPEIEIPYSELPVYTVLIPMYKEPSIVPIIAASMRRMNYPLSKLDVKFVLEESDTETLKAVQELNLERIFSVIRVPKGIVQTKPRACSFALPYARGEYLTIYDAEDKPEPDQLIKAVKRFKTLPDKFVCLQACLNYFNVEENWLTRMFTLEYSLWFDLYLPAHEVLDIPLPLGGTSNHFKTAALREVNAWDPFNVTEDADLGVRLYQIGYEVGTLPSTTYEEANSQVKNWINQRSRWIKGYMQTYLVHMRNPIEFYQKTGTKGFFGFQLFVGGTILTALATPWLYSVFIYWLISMTDMFDAYFTSTLIAYGLLNLLLGNAFFIYLNMMGAYSRKNFDLILYAITVPAYWMLMSVAGYKGLYQLFTKPFYWEKTEHGISKFTQKERSEAMTQLGKG